MSGILNLLLAGAASIVKDAYFNLVTLLLNTTSTNGAQNNTFLDSSSNNFTITRNGNTTQGTFTPFSQTGWSNRLSSGNDLSGASNAGYQFDSGNFTVEGWFYFNTVGNAQFLSVAVAGALYWQYYAGALDFGNNAGGSVQASWSPVANTWYHIAAVRNGSTFTNYINGAVHSSGTAFNVTATGLLKIGYGGAGSFDGYISNIRIVKGTAVYTAAFTPPTVPLTAITNTQLLTCQANRFLDSSTNGIAISVNSGSPSVQAFSPFAPTTAYSTDVVGGSGYFDGSGDYLNLGGQSAFAFGTGDFTIQMWAYSQATGSGGSQPNLYDGRPAGTPSGNYPTIVIYTSNQIAYYVGAGIQISGGTMVLNTWNHIAVCRSGTSTKMYLNGVQTGSTWTDTTNYVIGTNRPTIGIDGNTVSGNYFTGYIAGLQVLKGTALYTGSTYTVPTAPPTPVTNTSILLNYTNAGIYDSAAKNDLETVGSAQVSTTQAKWGGTAMYFNGTGSYLTAPSSPVYDFSSGNFTIEVWYYPTISNPNAGIFSKRANGSVYAPFSLEFSSSLAPVFLASTSGSNWDINITSSVSCTQNAWNYIAVTRSGSTFTIYVNGSSGGTGSSSSALMTNTSSISVGAVAADGTRVLTGYLDDFRVTKGFARTVTSSPTAAFPIQ